MQEEKLNYNIISNSNYLNKPAYNSVYRAALIVGASLMLLSPQPVFAKGSSLKSTGEIVYDAKNDMSSYHVGTIKELVPLNQTEIMDVRKMENIVKLNEFREFVYDWNGNGAMPFSNALIDKCNDILDQLKYQPEVFPTACDSIQFEYEKENGEYLELEIFDSYIHVFKIDNEENETEFVENDILKINQMVVEFYG